MIFNNFKVIIILLLLLLVTDYLCYYLYYYLPGYGKYPLFIINYILLGRLLARRLDDFTFVAVYAPFLFLVFQFLSVQRQLSLDAVSPKFVF